MSAIYRQHQDTRDGKIYNCVLMPDGKWWSAENLAWDGSGVYYNNDPANGQIYGKLYGWDDAQVSCPPGTHLASDAEWGVLKGIIPSPDGVKLKANSTLWTPNTGTDDYGFAIVPSGHYNGLYYTNINIYCGLWTATGSGADGKYYAVNASSTSLFEGYVGKETRFSVRFIVDEFNYPTYPTVSIYPASGTLQGVQIVVIQGQGTIRYTLDGSEPTASSTVYTGPFRLASSATVKAKAFVNPLESTTTTSVLVIQGADFLKIPSYTAATLPYLLEQYKGDNP